MTGSHNTANDPREGETNRWKPTVLFWVVLGMLGFVALISMFSGSFFASLSFAAIIIFISGLYALFTKRPSWLGITSRKRAHLVTWSALAAAILIIPLLPNDSDAPKPTAAVSASPSAQEPSLPPSTPVAASNTVDMRLDEARALLRKEGFTVTVEDARANRTIMRDSNWVVATQDARTATVTLRAEKYADREGDARAAKVAAEYLAASGHPDWTAYCAAAGGSSWVCLSPSYSGMEDGAVLVALDTSDPALATTAAVDIMTATGFANPELQKVSVTDRHGVELASKRRSEVDIIDPNAPAPVAPVPAAPAPEAPAPAPVAPAPQPEAPASAYYANCQEARAAGAAPIHQGEPGYRTALDRDRDGIACDR